MTKDKKLIVGFCFKEKRSRQMIKLKTVVMKNGRSAYQGVCCKCGTKMFKIKKKGE